MKSRYGPAAALALALCPVWSEAQPQTTSGIDPEVLIERILTVDAEQRAKINTVSFEAEYVEGEQPTDGSFKEKTRFMKRIYIKYFSDTAWYHEDYIEYYKDGQLQTAEDRDKEAADRAEKKKSRKEYDISYPMLRPFTPQHRPQYDIAYEGVSPEKIGGYVCHHFTVKAKEEADSLINGEYYFDGEGFHLVRVEFSPAKLVKKAMFKMSELKMSVQYAPTSDSYWLPTEFDIRGHGRAMFLVGVNFSGTEYFRNPVVNGRIKDSIFEEKP
ncbi:MAG TPA: hypothetical protein VMS71_00555 [Candidatus Acidoferrum sp.]|nr:hypothetical protein [Candidatus Acidoferrum sp.]